LLSGCILRIVQLRQRASGNNIYAFHLFPLPGVGGGEDGKSHTLPLLYFDISAMQYLQ